MKIYGYNDFLLEQEFRDIISLLKENNTFEWDFENSVKPGDTVNLALEPLKCHAFDSSGHSLLKS